MSGVSSSYYYNSNSNSINNDNNGGSNTTTDGESKTVQIYFLCFSGILVLVLFLAKFLEDTPSLRRYLSEPAMTLLLGIFFSFIIRILNEADYEQYQEHYEEEYNAADYPEDFNEDEIADQYMGELPQFFLFFPNNVFFMALLPPILFNSGYQLQRELFYRHFSPIALYSLLGTCVAALGCGGFLILTKQWGLMGEFDPSNLELMTFGALIAATDTVSVVGVLQRKRVDPHLFSLVFGESALNDAVAIVLFKTLAGFLTYNHTNGTTNNNNYNNNNDDYNEPETFGLKYGKYLLDLCFQAVVSPILGLLFAGVMSLAFKHIDMREHRILELSLYILPVYIPFILAELLELSGMITIFTTGIFARRYMEPNVSAPTGEYAGILFQLLSFLAETCIFLELGLSVSALHKSYYFGFISLAFVAALLGRALSVYPISYLYNFSLTRPVPVNVVCSAINPGTSCGATNDAVDATASNYQLASKDGIIMDAATTLNQQASENDDNGMSAGTSNVDTTRQETFEYTGNDRTDRDEPSCSRNNDPIVTPNPFQVTVSKTTSYLRDLPRRRETPARKRDKIIPLKFMHILWFAGLRGAVAYACAREFPDVNGNKNAFIAATMCIVLVTIVIMGGATESLMECVNIRMGVDNDEYMKIWHKQRRLKGRFLHFEYNYIYRFVVRDNHVNFMDESCGHLHQVDDNRIALGHGGRRLPLIRNLKGTADGGSSSGHVQSLNRAGRSLVDDSSDGKNTGQRRVQIAVEGDLDDELGFIVAQLNSSQAPPPLQTTLSTGSSFDGGRYDWEMACKL